MMHGPYLCLLLDWSQGSHLFKGGGQNFIDTAERALDFVGER